MTEMATMAGYVGKILRINLTDSTTEIIPTSKYVPKYIGGRAVCNRIFWEEVPPGVKAFDPENKLIYMTGPGTCTGIPTGGRTVFTGIAPNSYPEMYAWSGIGGFFGTNLKFAGYDGFILEGAAAEHTYIVIEDDTVEFRNADHLWGKLVQDTQLTLERELGEEFSSIVIGPAGENLMRNASLTTNNDSVAAKAGFGAVWGSKNLKAISIHGTGEVTPSDIEKMLLLRQTMGVPTQELNPVWVQYKYGMPFDAEDIPEGLLRGQIACSYGCNQRCNKLFFDTPSAFTEKPVNCVEKCVGEFAAGWTVDLSVCLHHNFESIQNHNKHYRFHAGNLLVKDETDPHVDEICRFLPGDIENLWNTDWKRGMKWMDLCNEYGIDKWDIIVWYFTWLSMCKQEGLLDDIDFGMEVDVESEEFIRYFMKMLVYRTGPDITLPDGTKRTIGDLLAEGMARVIRSLGMEKYGKSIYHNRYSQVIPGKQLDIPVSFELAWGHTYHWSGRGMQSGITKPGWVATALTSMVSSRDAQTISHHHDTFDHYLELKDDPCRSPLTAEAVVLAENKAQLKDSVPCCDWQSPNLYWPDMEANMFSVATGIPTTNEEMDASAERANLLFRAILMRDTRRNREMEVNEIFPALQYPDSEGLTVDWDEWNDLVDLYYDARGWDRETGWPTRETWEKYGLEDIADEMEKISMLP
jgi:aldehyde:ferredoxin oxidoreductase